MYFRNGSQISIRYPGPHTSPVSGEKKINKKTAQSCPASVPDFSILVVSKVHWSSIMIMMPDGDFQYVADLQRKVLSDRVVVRTDHPSNSLRYSVGKVRNRAVTHRSPGPCEGQQCRNFRPSRSMQPYIGCQPQQVIHKQY